MKKGKGTPAMTVREAGRRGGATTQARYGREFYQKIGKKGGVTNSAKHGREFYAEIGKKGGQIIRELVQRGKVLEAKKGRP